MAEGQSLDGVYRLIGCNDMACAFQFVKRVNLIFFMSYGAIDRTATGKYTLHNGLIQLQSDKIPRTRYLKFCIKIIQVMILK